MKVLVIDDEKPTVSMFRLFLDAYGYEAFTAEDGETGLALCRDIRPDIVFTDIRMPGIDGLTVLSRIKEMAPSVEVIIITGHGDMEKALQALDLGASDFINKPVERAALNAALVRAERRRQMPGEVGFDMQEGPHSRDRVLDVTVRGKLSGAEELVLKRTLAAEKLARTATINLILDDTFSIDRSGITVLMETLRRINRSGVPVVFKNVPYNYLKVFQMAGMDKLAVFENESVAD